MESGTKRFLRGLVLMVLSTFFFSTKPILVRIALDHGVAPEPLMILRLAVAFPLFLATVALTGKHRGMLLSVREYGVVAAVAIIGMGGAMIFSFYSIQHLGASVSTLVIFIFPALTTVMAFFFFRQPITALKGISLSVSFVGIMFVVMPIASLHGIVAAVRSGGGGVHAHGIMFGLLAATCWSGTQIMFEKMTRTHSTEVLSAYTTGIMLVFYTAWFGLPEIGYRPETWGVIVLLGTVGWYFPFLLAIYGIKEIGASDGAIVQSIGPGLVVLLSWLLLGETLTAAQFFGMVLLIFAVSLLRNDKKIV